MKYLARPIIIFLVALDFALGLWLLTRNNVFAVLIPLGSIGIQERNLMIFALILGFIVVIPVFIFGIFVATHYRASNHKAEYLPEWDNPKLQPLLWIFPVIIISILAVITWIAAHKLDPSVAIASNVKPLTVEVIALRWKWLFIYPEQGIATVNYLAIPEKTPIHFELTADESPMNSFWIPQLGGQIYAMTGMITQTHLIADTTGEFRGSSAEISGQGFAGMDFRTKSMTNNDFSNWVTSVKQANNRLDDYTYSCLALPSEHTPPTFYSSTESDLYTKIVMKYMSPSMNGKMEN